MSRLQQHQEGLEELAVLLQSDGSFSNAVLAAQRANALLAPLRVFQHLEDLLGRLLIVLHTVLLSEDSITPSCLVQ